MSPDLFPDLPDQSRTWIFVLDGDPDPCRQVLQRVEMFLDLWVSHGRAVTGRATLAHGIFLIISGRVSRGQISGCSIDSLNRAVTDAASDAGCKLVSPMKISFEGPDGEVSFASRPVFRQLLRTGQVDPSTPVFDPSVNELRALRAGRFVQPLSHSPFARAFGV